MLVRGIHYDVGTATLDGTSTRPSLSAEQMEREVRDIANGLHANAVRITGGDVDRIAAAADIAMRLGLRPWLSPMLPNASAEQTLVAIEAAGRAAETFREATLVVGCELSVFMAGILPGATHGDRLALLSDQARLMSEVIGRGLDPIGAFARFMHDAVTRARAAFRGPITYAAGAWEQVDWAAFDVVGVDAYRDRTNRASYVEVLRALRAHGKPAVATELGCATYRGAGDAGATAWIAAERVPGSTTRRLRAGTERDEQEQAREIGEALAAVDASGIDGAFVYTYVAPSYPANDDDVALDLDAASYALVRTWPDGRAARKAAFDEVARRFT